MNPDNHEKNRKLTPAEERRSNRFEETGRKLEEQGYKRKDLTVGLVKANLFVVLLAIPVMLLGIVLFNLKNGGLVRLSLSGTELLVYLALYVILIVIHELVHGLTWAINAEGRFRSIEFGFIKEYLTPYCVCTVPLGRDQYILGALMPMLALGILPTVLGILFGSALLFWIGILMILSAGGDLLIVLQILLYKNPSSEKLFLDHPTQAGVVVYER